MGAKPLSRGPPTKLARAVEMNEALILSSVRQHEMTEAAERLNTQLRAEIHAREEIAKELSKTARELADKARLLDLTHDAIIVRDTDGCIRYWNRGAEKLYGWSLAEALGKASHELLKTEFSVPVEQMVEELHRTNRWTGELVHKTRDGRRLIVFVRKTLDRDQDGNPASVLENITNITERHLAEEALRVSEAFNRSIIESSPDCITILDLEGNLLSMEAGQDLLGIEDIRPFLQRPWLDFWDDPKDRAAARSALQTAVSGGDGSFVGFFRTLRSEPKWWDVAISPIRDAEGRPARLLAVSRDVTERRHADEALRVSEERYSSIFNQTTGGIAELDLAGCFLLMNDRFCQLMGRSREQLRGLQMNDITHPEDLPASIENLGALLAGSIPSFVMEKRYLRPDGTALWAQSDVAAIRDAQGRVRSLTVAVTDITERRLLEDALVARADDLARADRSKDEFLAMLAHELRNPLAPLRNASEFLQTVNTTAGERAQAALIIDRQIGNMSRMIDDLLDVSRITEGKIDLRTKPVALEFIITAATSLARSSCAARGQRLTVSMPTEPVFLEADATRLEQVFNNLLTNASKYSGEGSHISLSAERADDTEPPEVAVTVRDDGAGIDPELLPHVFDLFVQASRTLDRTHGGLGIGLTLVSRLVKLHGGSIKAHSEGLGHGAEFTVRLPILREAPPLPPLPPPPSRAALEKTRRILIVDDNSDSARSLAMLEKRRGHIVCTAFTGPDAVTAAAGFLPDVVLLDIGLPGMDGFEVARQIRSMPALSGVLLIAMSGYGSDADLATARQAGFDEYLVKPVGLDELHERLQRMN